MFLRSTFLNAGRPANNNSPIGNNRRLSSIEQDFQRQSRRAFATRLGWAFDRLKLCGYFQVATFTSLLTVATNPYSRVSDPLSATQPYAASHFHTGATRLETLSQYSFFDPSAED